MDYKATLNLPKTDFPMHGKLPEREPQTLARWEEMQVYYRLLESRQAAPVFILHDGPPYANGRIHIGHAVNKILKDIINKSRLAGGYRVPYVPGWDCHGLPIEIQVEKEVGRPGEKISAQAFRNACRAYADSQVASQKQDFMRLGILGDWDNPYLTMHFQAEADILRELGRLVVSGQVYRGAKPVHWCVDCGSALAEAEVEYQDRTDPAIDVAFAVANPEDLAGRLGLSSPLSADVAIWTTTPWTLPANQAVAVHPEYLYVLVAAGSQHLILAETLAESALARYGHQPATPLACFAGRVLEGMLLRHPFEDRSVPVILGEHVTVEAGTGCVHTAPAHGVEDYQIGRHYHLPVETPLLGSGRYQEGLGHGLGGLDTQEANQRIPALLHTLGRLVHMEKLSHSYPHCWRHKTPLLFRATPQWFISMEDGGLRQKALTAIESTRWIPEWGRERIRQMVEQRPDWCISRQRAWGVPVAIFACTQCGEPLRDPAVFARVALAVEESGVDAWFSAPEEQFLGSGDRCCSQCGHPEFAKVTDILDVWFDSGSTHAFVLERRAELSSPADLYLEGSDQHRGWFQSSLLESVGTRNRAPYRTVLTHGFTVDGAGRKMSKSLGNVIAPQEIIDRFGADILRLWVASEDYRGEIPISDSILQRLGDSYRRIRNTARYILGNTYDFDAERHALPAGQLLELDRWMLLRTATVQNQVQDAYQEYQFHRVVQILHNFCAVDLGGLYLEVLKDRLYTLPAGSRARRSAQTVLHRILEAMLVWMAPILSFTAEEIWQHLPGRSAHSVFFSLYPEFPAIAGAGTLEDRWQRLALLREGINGRLEVLRQEKLIGTALDASIRIHADQNWRDFLSPLSEELRFYLLCSGLEITPLETADSASEEILPGLRVTAEPAGAPKCIRCWHRRRDIGGHSSHPGLCGRCVENLETAGGENREYC